MNCLRIWLCATLLTTLASCAKTPELPTATPGSRASPTQIPQPEPSVTTTPSPDPASLVTPRPESVTLSRQILPSPDGEWIAEASFEHLNDGESYRVRLAVGRSDGAVWWTPVDYTQSGLGYTYPALRYWSPDSRTFYFFNMQTPDGCSDFYPIEDEWNALNVEDGSLTTLPLPDGRGHTISPDGTVMVYASARPPYGLHFRNTLTSTEEFLRLPVDEVDTREVQAGGIVWSPDGGAFALSVAYGDSCKPDALSFSILRVEDPAHPVFIPLIEESPKLIRMTIWDPSGRILARDWNGDSWWMDAQNGKIATAPDTYVP
jgi:hypothetical protein